MSTETLSIRIDSETKRKLDELAQRTRRSKSFLAAEAIAAMVKLESWQIGEIQAGIVELDGGQGIAGADVRNLAKNWGKSKLKKSK